MPAQGLLIYVASNLVGGTIAGAKCQDDVGKRAIVVISPRRELASRRLV